MCNIIWAGSTLLPLCGAAQVTTVIVARKIEQWTTSVMWDSVRQQWQALPISEGDRSLPENTGEEWKVMRLFAWKQWWGLRKKKNTSRTKWCSGSVILRCVRFKVWVSFLSAVSVLICMATTKFPLMLQVCVFHTVSIHGFQEIYQINPLFIHLINYKAKPNCFTSNCVTLFYCLVSVYIKKKCQYVCIDSLLNNGLLTWM